MYGQGYGYAPDFSNFGQQNGFAQQQQQQFGYGMTNGYPMQMQMQNGYGYGYAQPVQNGFQNTYQSAPAPAPAPLAPAPEPISFNNQSNRQTSYSSRMEQMILQSNTPIATNETQTVSANGITGILLNRAENASWRGSMPIEQYKVNTDTNYKVIRKQGGRVQQVQEVQVKYLNPPAAAPAGDIIIKQESDVSEPAAPPLIIRQEAPPKRGLEPVVIREEPPASTRSIPPVTITLPGRRVPPPPRKVIIERLPSAPAPPQDVIIERWLAPQEQTRRVRFIPGQKLADQYVERNVLIEWDDPQVELRQRVKFLGVQNIDPNDYRARYGSSLTRSLPKIANSGEVTKYTAPGQQLALNARYAGLPRLVGDVDALRLVPDLERYGLGEYRSQIGAGEYRSQREYKQSFFRERSPSPQPLFQTPTATVTQRSPSPIIQSRPVQYVEQTRYFRGSSPAPLNESNMYIRSSPSPTPAVLNLSNVGSAPSAMSNQDPITAAALVAQALDRE